MEISGKNLLHQAESILRDRKQENKSSRSQSEKSVNSSGKIRAGGVELNQGVLESRVMGLQETMKSLQNDYSREQTRYAYLTKSPEKINKTLSFADEPLFPELEKEGDLSGLEGSVKEKMTEILRGLKASQVEMENLFALNFQERDHFSLEPGSMAGFHQNSQLDPERVARLTRP